MPVQKVTNELILDPASRIRMLTDHGSSVQINRAIPVKRYLRSGSEMERQARVYYGEKQFDKAFILYNKFATLFIEKLPKHPEYATAAPTEKARIKKLLKDVFPRAMELKKTLKEQYEKEKEELEKQLAEEEAQRKAEEARSRAERQRRQAEEEKRRVDEQQRQMEEERRRKEELEAEQLAAFLAGEGGVVVKNGMETRTEPRENVDPSILLVQNIAYESVEVEPTPQEQQGTTTTAQTGLAGITVPEAVPVSEPQTTTQADLTATDPNLAHVLPPPPPYQDATANQPNPAPVAPPPAPAVTPPAAALLQSPTQHVPATSLRTYHSIFQAPSAPPPPQAAYHQPSSPYGGNYFQQQPPLLYGAPPPQQQPPYAQQYSGSWGTVQAPPPVYHTPPPGYYQQAPMETEEEEGEEEGPQVPTVDRSNKPTYNALSTSLGGMNEGYRQVYVPTDTASMFLQAASTNTRRNIETCGILAGKLSQNVLRITHIIVPKQKGSSDSCETLQEEELFDVQDKYDLITLGWIHTHPSQTAFMSSVDLHTHCSYQIMLDEAIAIVCAPKHSQVGVYMLTEPHGLDLITHCEEPGFHTHRKEPPIYEECKHVHFDGGSFITIEDLR